jgi:hypothetical protein
VLELLNARLNVSLRGLVEIIERYLWRVSVPDLAGERERPAVWDDDFVDRFKLEHLDYRPGLYAVRAIYLNDMNLAYLSRDSSTPTA